MSKKKAEASLEKYTELFKKSEALLEIRNQYTQLLNEKFKDASFLKHYQDAKRKIHADEMNKLTAAMAIQKAYPQVVYDKQGKAKDNREQNYIAAVEKFVKVIEARLARKVNLHKEEQELLLATKVYAALNSVENSWAILKKRMEEKKMAAEDEKEAYDDAIKMGLNSFSEYCVNLKDSLKDHQHILKRSERATTWFGKVINFIDDLIKSIKAYKKLNDEPKPDKLQHKEKPDKKPSSELFFAKKAYVKNKADFEHALTNLRKKNPNRLKK